MTYITCRGLPSSSSCMCACTPRCRGISATKGQSKYWTTILTCMHDDVRTYLCVTAVSPLAGEVSTLAERMFCFRSYPVPLPSQLRLDQQTCRACSSLPESQCSLVELIWHQLKGNQQYLHSTAIQLDTRNVSHVSRSTAAMCLTCHQISYKLFYSDLL